jgi:hypothetical protein
MPTEFYIALLFVTAIPTCIAILVSYATVIVVQTTVCRIVVVVMHIHPWSWGSGTFLEMWKKDYSRREIFLATWFIAFVVSLFCVGYFSKKIGL